MAQAISSDWDDVVDRMRQWLDAAAARLDRHESDFAAFAFGEPPSPESGALAKRLTELSATMEPFERRVREADAAAEEAERALAELSRRSERARLRLAEGAGRAIG